MIECYDLATIVDFGTRMLLMEVSKLEISMMDSRDRKICDSFGNSTFHGIFADPRLIRESGVLSIGLSWQFVF
jgi:hypothetical protein